MKDQASLVCQIKDGNRTAFNELYRIHYAPLCAYAELLLDKEGAQDVVQDVFLTIWLHRERLDETLSFRGYLLRSVYNTSLNVLKSKTYSSKADQEIETITHTCFDPDENDIIRKLYNEELQNDINYAIDCLSPKCKEVFSLSYLEDMPSKDISQYLGLSLRTVESHIYTALKQLREKLSRYKAILFIYCIFL